MDVVSHKVWRSGNLIELSKTEFNLLLSIAQQRANRDTQTNWFRSLEH